MKYKRKLYPKDIGMRWCITCGQQTKFRWFAYKNAFACEKCCYEEALHTTVNTLLNSEEAFLRELDKLDG